MVMHRIHHDHKMDIRQSALEWEMIEKLFASYCGVGLRK